MVYLNGTVLGICFFDILKLDSFPMITKIYVFLFKFMSSVPKIPPLARLTNRNPRGAIFIRASRDLLLQNSRW